MSLSTVAVTFAPATIAYRKDNCQCKANLNPAPDSLRCAHGKSTTRKCLGAIGFLPEDDEVVFFKDYMVKLKGTSQPQKKPSWLVREENPTASPIISDGMNEKRFYDELILR